MIALVVSSLEASLLSGGMIVNPRDFELFKSVMICRGSFHGFGKALKIKDIHERANENSK